IAGEVGPHAEVRTLIRFVRTDVLRQTTDEEVLLYPNGAAPPFAEFSAEHARLHALTDRLALADAAACSLVELGRLITRLVQLFEHHLVAEQAALAKLADIGAAAPATADVRSGARIWRSPDDTPVRGAACGGSREDVHRASAAAAGRAGSRRLLQPGCPTASGAPVAVRLRRDWLRIRAAADRSRFRGAAGYPPEQPLSRLTAPRLRPRARTLHAEPPDTRGTRR